MKAADDGGFRFAELRWSLAWAAALAALTSIPYVIGAASTPTGMHYLGFVYNPDEPNVHLSWIRQALDGAVFLRNQFSAEPHVGRFFNLFMLFVGRVAALAHLTPQEAWAIARVAGAVALGVACYLPIVALFRSKPARHLALAVVTLSSGFGWFYVGSAEGGAYGGLLNPVTLLSLGLLLMGVGFGERALRDGDLRSGGACLVIGLLLHGVPRADALLLVVALGAYLLALYLNDDRPDEGLSALWRRRLWGWLLLIAVTRPPVVFEDPLSLVAALVMLSTVLAYLAVLITTQRREVGWVRFGFLALASAAAWLALGTKLGMDPIDVEPDLVMPEAITFLSLYLSPLFSVSMALLVATLTLGERALRGARPALALAPAVLGLLLANVHTYDAVPVLGTLGVYLLWLLWREPERRADRGWAFGVLLLFMLPAVGYQYQLIHSDPLYAAKANTVTATPPLVAMLVSYGLLVPLALYGAVELLRKGRAPAQFLVVWALVQTACIYLPTELFPFQRKMIEGLHVVLAILAAAGVLAVARRVATLIAWGATWQSYQQAGAAWAVRADAACRRNGWLGPVAVLGLLLLVPSNALFVQSTLNELKANNQNKEAVGMPPFYLEEPEMAAMAWMATNLPRDAVVGCLPWVGSYLPGRTDRTVYCGHWAETINFGAKLAALGAFLKEPGTAQEKLAFLREAGITHLYFGGYEQRYTGGVLPQLPELERIYPKDAPPPPALPPVAIYRVKPEGETAAAKP